MSKSTPVSGLPFGVNVVGYLRSELGVGELAREVIAALDACDVPTLPIAIPNELVRQGHHFACSRIGRPVFAINLICLNANALPWFAATAPDFFPGRYSIGWWSWETSRFPAEWLGAFDPLDEVWVGSAFTAKALSPRSPIPVANVRQPIVLPAQVRANRSAFALNPDEFIFLFVFDYHSICRRKNPLGLIEAFVAAFPPGSGATLIVKSINGSLHPAAHHAVLAAAAVHPDIRVLDEYLSPGDKNELIASCDCYVSLHRSEGFGITMAEAMWLAKPVIATGYSGNTEYMTPSNSYPVDYTLMPVGAGAHPYPAHHEWAEPNLEHAAALMRTVFDNRDQALTLGLRAAADMHRRHSPAAAGAEIAARLEAGRARVISGRSTVTEKGALRRVARGHGRVLPEPGRFSSSRGLRWASGAGRVPRLLQRIAAAAQPSAEELRDRIDRLSASIMALEDPPEDGVADHVGVTEADLLRRIRRLEAQLSSRARQ